MSLSFFYNDLLFEIYHYIPKYHIPLLNKVCKRLEIIDGRIKRYVYRKRYDNLDEGLYDACFNGNMKFVRLMIKRGANYWDAGLYGACFNGHMKIVKLMIKRGAIRCHNCDKSIQEHLLKK
jgi:hypothetical protein